MGKRKKSKKVECESDVSLNTANNNTEKKGNKRNFQKTPQEATNTNESDIVPRKRKKRNQPVVASTIEIQEELDPKKPIIETEPSIRAKKKQKRNNIQQQEKVKHVLDMQQQCLNYLSLWKHSRTAWKFQKLKQVWIYNNIFDDVKIPNEFFLTAIEYFNNGKGNLKEKLLEQASKIIDGEGEETKKDEENDDDNEKDDEKEEDGSKEGDSVKFQRARTIMQNMN